MQQVCIKHLLLLASMLSAENTEAKDFFPLMVHFPFQVLVAHEDLSLSILDGGIGI